MSLMKKIIYGIAIVLTGCSPIYYTPTSQNVTLFTQGGQTNLNLSGNSNRVEFMGAHALTQHWAIQGNGGLFIPKSHENENGGSGNYVEAGLGYYAVVNENFVFESYGQVGYGGVENHFPSTVNDNPGTTGKIQANLFRYGIQPAFGWRSTYFSVALSSRFAGLSYSNVQGSLVFDNEDQVAYLNEHDTHFLVEPALTLRGGLKKIKLQVQVGRSFNVTKQDFRQDKALLTVGLNFNFE